MSRNSETGSWICKAVAVGLLVAAFLLAYGPKPPQESPSQAAIRVQNARWGLQALFRGEATSDVLPNGFESQLKTLGQRRYVTRPGVTDGPGGAISIHFVSDSYPQAPVTVTLEREGDVWRVTKIDPPSREQVGWLHNPTEEDLSQVQHLLGGKASTLTVSMPLRQRFRVWGRYGVVASRYTSLDGTPSIMLTTRSGKPPRGCLSGEVVIVKNNKARVVGVH